MKKGFNKVFFILYVLFGVYSLNIALNFWNIPEVILKINSWLIFVGGVLLILASFKFLKGNSL